MSPLGFYRPGRPHHWPTPTHTSGSDDSLHTQDSDKAAGLTSGTGFYSQQEQREYPCPSCPLSLGPT